MSCDGARENFLIDANQINRLMLDTEAELLRRCDGLKPVGQWGEAEGVARASSSL